MATEQVVVEFVADTTGLQPAVDKLQQMGQIDDQSAVIFKNTNDQIKQRNLLLQESLKNSSQLSASVNEQQTIYNKLVASVKNLSGASKDAVQQLLKMSAGDIAQGFKEAAVNVDDYVKVLEDASKGAQDTASSHIRLRTQILTLTNEMAQLKEQGLQNTEQYDQLALKAGELTNNLKQQQIVVKNLSSDAPILNSFAEAISGLAGAFQAGVAAASIFGDENKDLQATLVKVVQVTAIAQGIQQALNLTRKEGALSTLALVTSQKLNNAQTAISNALESESIIVRTGATVAQYALNLSMSLNPIGLFVVALSLLVTGLVAYSKAATEAEIEQKNLNAAIEDAIKLADDNAAVTKRNTSEQLSALDELNAKQSEKLRAQATEALKIAQGLEQKRDELRALQFANESSHDVKLQELAKKAGEEADKADQQLLQANVDFNNKRRELEKQVSVEALQADKDRADAQISLAKKNTDALFAAQRLAATAQLQLDLKAAGDNEEKKFQIQSAFQRQLQDINAAQEAQHEANRQSILSANLIKIQTENRRINNIIAADETAAQIKILQDRAAYEINLEGTTAERKKQIRAQLQLDIEQLNREQLNRDIVAANQEEIAKANVILDGIKATNADRLKLEISNVLDQRAIDLTATNLTENQRLAIIAASEQKIRELKNNSIEQIARDTIEITAAQNLVANNELQRQLDAQQQIRASSNPKREAALLGVDILSLDQQKAAIDKLTQFQLEQNQKLITANDEKQQTDEEYYKNEVILIAESNRIFEDGEDKKRKAAKETADFQLQMQKAIVNESLQGVSQGLQILQSLYQQQDQEAQAKLDRQKQRIQDELDAGAITAKAAAERNKEIEAQQKVLQREQAKRNKELAIFQAIIGTAQAVVQALDAPPPLSFISAAIAGALGAAQIAVITSQPLPQFSRGKNNDSYEGWGEIGEKGPELWQSGSQMKLAERSSIVWLKRDDKVFNAQQTAAIMSGKIPVGRGRGNGDSFDYQKLAEAVSKKSSISLSIDGYKEFIQTEKDFTTILNSRRKW